MPRRYSQLPHPSIRLRYLYPPHGAWPILPAFKSLPHFQPVRFQVAGQVFYFHPIYSRRSFVALYSLQCSPQVLSFEHRFPHCYHVGFSAASYRERLGTLLHSRRLHLLRWFSSPFIQGFLPSSFVPRPPHRTPPLLPPPSPLLSRYH